MQVGDWHLMPERAAVHLPSRTVVVADLHLGYDRVRRRGGEAIPGRLLSIELAPLGRLLERERLSRLVVAGDLFEDGRHQREQMVEEFLGWVTGRGVDLVGVVPGNHDRGLGGAHLPVRPGGLELGGWQIVHGDGERPAGPVVQGHEHPWLRWQPGVEGPCFLVRGAHLVLPAYSRDAAGVNVLAGVHWKEYRCGVIAGERVLDFGILETLLKSRKR